MKRVGALLLIFIGSALVVIVAAYTLVTSAVDQPKAAPLPDNLTGLPLTRASSGKNAAVEISRLHYQEFMLTSAAVGVYGGSQATIWAAGAPARSLAVRMLAEMESKIAEGRSPFSPVGKRTDGGREIYELDGLGQKHFYFRSNNLLVWLAADMSLSEQALIQTLEYYP